MTIKNYTNVPTPPDTSQMTRKELAEYHHKRLLSIRDNFSDEIPVEIIHSTSPNIMYKCRAAWWSCLAIRFHLLQKIKMIQNSTFEKYLQTEAAYSALIEKKQLVTPSNIKSANETINAAIADLEGIIAKES